MVIKRPTLQQIYNTVTPLLVATLIILIVCLKRRDSEKIRDIVAVASLLHNETENLQDHSSSIQCSDTNGW